MSASAASSVDLAPLAGILAVGLLLALLPLGWAWRHGRHATPAVRLRALTLTTLFLTFDLVLFGAFTRLTDSGLGCPDWPGCYGSASPVGALVHIDAAQVAIPTGAVTLTKAWIEMAHRYLATAVGALIVLLAAMSWLDAWCLRRSRAATFWPTATLVWVCVQGAFGALTVTMKLYPAIVTLHLLGGIGLLVLLTVQLQKVSPSAALPPRFTPGLWAVGLLVVLQIALGGWVSTNYAVLACRDFPLCQGAWWPPMDFAAGFDVRRGLGLAADGAYLPFAALTAIHEAHRLAAIIVVAGLFLLARKLARTALADLRRWAWPLVGLALWQVATGLSNVVLGWPLAAAVGHTAGAAALAMLLAVLLTRAVKARRAQHASQPPSRTAAPAAS